MGSIPPRVALAVVAALALTCAVAVAAARSVSPAGVGAVKLGKTYASLRADGLLGKIAPGCELAGPNTRSAPLRPPLTGSVDLTRTSPRRVRAITVSRGAAARGVGIGARAAAIRRAFPRVVFDRSIETTFGVTIARVPKGGGGRLEFALGAHSKKVVLIGVPRIPFCE